MVLKWQLWIDDWLKGDFEIYANDGDLYLLNEVGRWVWSDEIVNDWGKLDYGGFG